MPPVNQQLVGNRPVRAGNSMSGILFRFTLISFLPLLLAAQSSSSAKVWGTINGQPIADKTFNPSRKLATDFFVFEHKREPANASDEQEIDSKVKKMECDGLRSAVSTGARDMVKQELGVLVTQQDLDAARKEYLSHDPVQDLPGMRNKAAAILNGLSAVYDQHQDPDQAYEQKVQNQIPKDLWRVYVHDASTPEGRQKTEKMFRRQLTVTPNEVTQAVASPKTWQATAENLKIDSAVDQRLAATDPQFRTYWEAYERSARQEGSVTRWSFTLEQKQYLDQKRIDFWKAETAKLDVYLSDPSLGTACGLSSMGVRLAGQ